MTAASSATLQQSESDSFDQELQRADKLLKQGKLQEALAVAEPLVQQAPHYVPLLRVAGFAALKSEQYPKAEQYLSAALEYDKKRGRALGAMANLYRRAENYPEEKRTLRELLRLRVLSAEDIHFQIEAAHRLEKQRLEKKLLRKALWAFPQDEKFSSYWSSRLSKLLSRSDCHWLEQKVSKETSSTVFTTLLIELYLETGQANRALEVLQEHHQQLQKVDKWLPLYRRCSVASRIHSPFPFLYFGLLDTLPDDHYAYGEIGKRIARSPDFRMLSQPTPKWKVMQARDHLLAAKLLGSDDEDLDAHLIDCCIDLEQLENAKELLAPFEGTALFERAPYIRVRAKLLAKQGNLEDARSLLQDLLSAAPKDQYTIELLDEMNLALSTTAEEQSLCSHEEYLQNSFVHHRVSEGVLQHLIRANAHYGYTVRAEELVVFACSAFPQKKDRFTPLLQRAL